MKNVGYICGQEGQIHVPYQWRRLERSEECAGKTLAADAETTGAWLCKRLSSSGRINTSHSTLPSTHTLLLEFNFLQNMEKCEAVFIYFSKKKITFFFFYILDLSMKILTSKCTLTIFCES